MSHPLPNRPAPGPDCARYALLLPLLDADALTTAEASTVRRHTDGCPWCQQQLAAYATVDAALHGYLGALMAEAPIQTEESMMWMSKRSEHEHSANSAHGTIDTSHEVKVNNGATTPIARRRASTPVHSLLAGAVAVLIVGLLATTFAVFSHRSTSRVGAPATAIPATATATSLSTPAAQETPYVAGANDGLNAIQMFSPGEGWAVGESGAGSTEQQGISSSLVLHYSHGRWMRVPSPTNAQLGVVDASLQSIAMVSPEEGWAVGAAGDLSVGHLPVGLILHYSGGKWTKFSMTPDEELWGVQMLTSTDGWAVGGGGWHTMGMAGATTSILLHFDGTKWTQVSVPNVAGITSLDMLSANDGWASGTDTILHFDGTQWRIFAHLQGISGVSMDSATDGWAFGYVNFPYNHTASYNVVWHYNGSQWVQGALPSSVDYNAAVQGMAMDSARDGWAVGYGNGQKGGNRYALYLHYSHGQWTQVQGPGHDNLSGVFMLSAHEGWAVGNGGTLMHDLNGTWTQYQA